MIYTFLGRTGLQVSRICLGTMNFGEHIDEPVSFQIMVEALEKGINFFDTADIYGLGKSEELLSKALGSKRKEVVISTKFGVSWEKKQRKRALTFYDSSPKAITKALEGSLKRLKLDSIPLYFMHWPDPKTPIEESIETFESAYLIDPTDIDLLLQYASAIAASQEGQFDGKSKALIEEAFILDPQSIQVLYFSGIVAAHEGNLNGAIEYWQKALYLMPEDHPDRNIIEEALETILNLQVK